MSTSFSPSLEPVWILLRSETFWVAFTALVALAGLLYTFTRHQRQTGSERSRAKRDLRLKEIEWGEMNARHEREYKEGLGRCEGEIRRHEWGTVNTLTAEDNGMLADLVSHQRRESGRLMTEIGHLTEQAGEQVGFIIRVSLWDKFKTRIIGWFR